VDRTKLVETEKQRARTVTAYTEAVRLATLRYQSGLSAYFEVLDAQQQLFPAEISLVQTHRDQLLAVVSLYKALGGGWPIVPPGPPSDAHGSGSSVGRKPPD
jgi:outer membrane protein, multidrug efflux system